MVPKLDVPLLTVMLGTCLLAKPAALIFTGNRNPPGQSLT